MTAGAVVTDDEDLTSTFRFLALFFIGATLVALGLLAGVIALIVWAVNR